MNSKTAMAAVLAVLISFSLGMVVVSDGSEAAPTDAETIDEVTEFTSGDVYELDGKNLIFTEGGRLVFDSGSILSINGSTYLEGSDTIITLKQGAVVMLMDAPYAIVETMDVGLDGSLEYIVDMDLLSESPSGSVSLDISDGGEVSMFGGVTKGGPGKEVDAQVSIGGNGMAVSMSMNLPYSSGTITSGLLSSLFPGMIIPFESVYAEQTGMTFEMKFSMDAATGEVRMTDIDGDGPAFMFMESCEYSVPGIAEISLEGMRMTFSYAVNGASVSIPIGIEVASVNASMTYGDVEVSAAISGLNADLAVVATTDGSASIGGGSGDGPFEIGMDSVTLSLTQGSDVAPVEMKASLSDARVLVSMGVVTGQTVPEIGVSLESDSAKLDFTATSEGVVTTASAFADGFRVEADVSSTRFSLSAQVDAARFDMSVDGSPMAIGADLSGMRADVNGDGTIQEATVSIDSVSMSSKVPVGASSYQTRNMEFQGIEVRSTGSTVSYLEVANMTSSGPGDIVDSVTETVSGLVLQPAGSPEVSIDSYRADIVGLDGSEGYVTAENVTGSQTGITGNYVYALGHNTYRALNGLSFVSSGIQVYDGMTVEFRDSYVGDVQVLGGTVNGTAHVCGGGIHTVADSERSFTVDGDGGFDAAFVFEDSSIVSAEASLCSDMYLGSYYTGIEPYDPVSGGVPYELGDDGTATFTDLGGGIIRVQVGLATFTLTVNGTATEYRYGTSVEVSASVSQDGMVFAGWYDGIQIALPGGDYHVRYDAEIQELWAPADYDVVDIDGSLSVDIGEGGVFFVADASELLGTRNAGLVTELTVTNNIGSVTVDLEGVGSGPLMVMMSEMGQTPVGYIDDAASGSKMYMMQASTLSPDGESAVLGSKVSFTESAPVSGITSYGQRVDMAPITGGQYQVGYGDGVVAFALGEPDDGGSGSPMLLVGAVIVVILVVAVVAVVLMRRRSPA